MKPTHTTRFPRRARRQGFVVLAAAVALFTIVGMMGLSIDLARLYIAKNELQAYADGAAVAAALRLNGTLEGLEEARTQAKTHPNRWALGTRAVPVVEVRFSQTSNGAYEAAPATATGYRFVRVRARGPLPLYFLPVLEGVSTKQMVEAVAGAGQSLVTSLDRGLLPYSPDAPCSGVIPNTPCTPENNFGFIPGKEYTLRWPPPNIKQRNNPKNWCQGDQDNNYITIATNEERGFIDIGDGAGANAIRNAIVNNAQSHALAIGDTIIPSGGNKGTESDALRERISQDTDTTSATHADYTAAGTGNDRRYGVLAVNDPLTNIVLGFALFYLPSNMCGNNNVATCCAEYVGPAVLPGSAGAGPAGAYRVRLFY